VPTSKEAATLPLGTDIWSVAFSPDGKLLATAGGDSGGPADLSLWDMDCINCGGAAAPGRPSE
jgi:hypothetical protein